MRIISNFSDYYDFPQQWGHDPHITYYRKEFWEKLPGYRRDYWDWYSTRDFKNKTMPSSYYIGFCGKIHQVLKVRDLWVFDVNQWMKENFRPRHKRNLFSTRKQQELSNWKKYFEKAPIFIVNSQDVEFNFCFKKKKLESFMDPLSLYQRLEQYMSNEWAINQKEIPVPSDRDMVSIKGFDKRSFRKDKEC